VSRVDLDQLHCCPMTHVGRLIRWLTVRRNFSSARLAAVIALLSAMVAIGAIAPADAQDAQPATELFMDAANGYSIRYPATWKREPTASAPGPGVALFLSTPYRNRMVVSIYPLTTRVTRYSSALYEKIGHDHVDTVVSIYRRLLTLTTIMRVQTENKSDDRSMIFWQGTSARDDRLNDWALVSEHVIPYGSNVMINVIFIGSEKISGISLAEDFGAATDWVMNSLSFTAR
jgi:hypothetical protein